MAFSKCAKCDNGNFEIKENSPSGSRYKLLFVQCSRCGCVVGSMDYLNIGTLIQDLENKINKNYHIDSVNSNLNIVNQNISKLYDRVLELERKLK